LLAVSFVTKPALRLPGGAFHFVATTAFKMMLTPGGSYFFSHRTASRRPDTWDNAAAMHAFPD
jgi:hypothetical protein